DLGSAHWRAAKAVFAMKSLVAAFGIVTNSMLLLATHRLSAKKAKRNVLIGACALFDVVHLSGILFGLTIMVGDGHLDSLTCSILQLLPELGVYEGCFCVFSIGIDRLVSVSFPAFYRNVTRFKYLAVHLVAILAFALYAPFLMINYYVPHRVICSLAGSFHGEGKSLWVQAMLTINLLTLIPYALTCHSLRTRDESSYTKRVFRSIELVMIFDVGAWFLAVALTKIVYSIDLSAKNRLVFLHLSGSLAHIGIAIKPIVYYFTSSEYRNIFRLLLGIERVTTPGSESTLLSFGPLLEYPILFGDGLTDSFTCSTELIISEIGVYSGCFLRALHRIGQAFIDHISLILSSTQQEDLPHHSSCNHIRICVILAVSDGRLLHPTTRRLRDSSGLSRGGTGVVEPGTSDC
ncbi:hypothetical protein PENTCL1PPCAC_9234, partial [Pristionchus entomophagus]